MIFIDFLLKNCFKREINSLYVIFFYFDEGIFDFFISYNVLNIGYVVIIVCLLVINLVKLN